jgi:hypothetical protein
MAWTWTSSSHSTADEEAGTARWQQYIGQEEEEEEEEVATDKEWQ